MIKNKQIGGRKEGLVFKEDKRGNTYQKIFFIPEVSNKKV
jgi:hypothetical protein